MNQLKAQEALTDEIVFGSTREIDYLLEKAVSAIDRQFGEGYAKENPILVAAYIQSGATLFSCVGAGTIEQAANTIAQAIEELATAVSALNDTST